MKPFAVLVIALFTASAAVAILVARKGAETNTLNTMKQSPEIITVRLLNEDGSASGPIPVPKVFKTDAEWKARLTPEQYEVSRAEGTERAFCGIFHDNHQQGVYFCVSCGLPLFRSDTKFDSGTGWPSFFQPFAEENVASRNDISYGMIRTDVRCVRCNAHLGHVFSDGPAPTGLRYCMNSAALNFKETGAAKKTKTILLGAGCFWGSEEAFSKVKGVTITEVGYAGGATKNPTYDDVCTHTTGHAEVVKVTYDPAVVPTRKLLDQFFEMHDPTTVNRQGLDFGDNYRSAIFFTEPEQETAAREAIVALEKDGNLSAPIVTQVELASPFYRAEEYHQKYAEKHGGGFCHLPSIK